jgi:protein-L-isoaspartate(D-aspartate) O-methyltransferase
MKRFLAAVTAGTVCAGVVIRLLAADPPKAPPKSLAEFTKARELMVDKEIVAAGVKNRRVIESMRDTPRHEFMPISERPNAYYDMALPIGESQTISPPFMVAYMTEQLDPKPTDKVLEIGTGSGYQAAILSPLVRDVYTIEIVKTLGERAERTLKRLQYKNVHTRIGDGFQGWPEAAPFDKIIVTCSPEKVPQALVDELKEGGRMVVPVGERYQQTLYLFEKKDGELKSLALLPTLFVPMTGRAEAQRTIQPDAAHPQVNNGSFEEAVDGVVIGWHYQRQMEWVESKTAPAGKHYVTFRNEDAGRGAQALQGMAIDGRKVHEIELSAWAKGKDVRPGRIQGEDATVFIQFYDERRAPLTHSFLDPWRGTFDWDRRAEKIIVPPQAREAILNVGLRGATGELSLDDIQVAPVKRKPQ